MEINERTHIEKRGECAEYTEDGENWVPLSAGTPVSMNFWGFMPGYLDETEEAFPIFLKYAMRDNPMKGEFLLPRSVDALLKEGKATVKVLKSADKWYGVTYKEDKPVVVEAFRKYDEGYTLTEIRDHLNNKGITNTRGTAITYGTIQHMLSNRRYIGEYSFRDVIVSDGIPAIVSQDLFDRVQEKLAKNKKAPARAKAEEAYLLATKIYCGHCGTSMNGESGKSRNGTIHRYYKCHAVKKKLNDCKKKSVKKEWIEDLVVKETMSMLMDDDAIEAIVSMLMRLQDEENTDLPMYEKQLKQTQTEIANIIAAIKKGVLSDSLQAELAKLDAQEKEIKIRIEEEKLEKPKIPEDFMRFWLHRFRKLDVTKESHRQMLIDTFVNRIYVFDDKLLLTFNYKDGTRTITLTDAKIAVEKNAGSNLDCSLAPIKGTANDTSAVPFILLLETDSNRR